MNFAVVHHLIALPRVSRTKYRLCLSRKCLSVGPYSLTQRRFSVAGDHHLLSVPPSESEKSTIFALSTPPGVRVSGPRAFDVWNLVVSRPNASPPDPWRMEKCSIVHPISRERLDDGLAVYFKGPKSFTTQDVVELHIHSGRALITSVLEALACLPYCRPAEPGEFTRQAVEGGRLDLAQKPETQRRQALLIADGTISKQYSQMRSAILRCLAHLEALIDFSDTDDVDTDAYEQARMLAKGLREDIIRHLEDHRGEIVRSGLKIAIFGPPNAGKSSLLNFLVVEVSLDFGGLLVTLADTAGLRDTDDIVESIGIQRAKQAVSSAAMSLCVLPSDAGLEELNSQVQELLCSTSNSFLVLNKSDLFSEESIQILSESLKLRYPFVKIWVTSFKSGDGTQKFVDELSRIAQSMQVWLYSYFQVQSLYLTGLGQEGLSVQPPFITNARHRSHFRTAEQHLSAFLDLGPNDLVVAAEEVRYALQAIGRVTGHVDIEDVLDELFKGFCIGK
ncbi:tRNA modification GTPase TrmE [Flagelloscypha sp. PMI_526]|nr:tRNA modification GTPase TrmE [Flagelloscypha sp. PMI_526]